jgi:hypothetical protein
VLSTTCNLTCCVGGALDSAAFRLHALAAVARNRTYGAETMLRHIIMALTLGLAVQMAAQPVSAQRPTRPAATGTWELLGETQVGFGVARDLISVGQSDDHFRNRSYDQLRLAAERGDVQMSIVRLRYINGYQEDVPLTQLVRSGQNVILPLPERRSYLSQIELIYSGRAEAGTGGLISGWQRPRMKVFGFNTRAGLPTAPQATDPNWMLLGENTVRFRGQREVLRLSNDEAWYRTRRFDKLHFRVSDGDVDMREIRIGYINGYTETIRAARNLRRNSDLTVDLPGERSYLRQIEMTYRARPGSWQKPTLKVYGERKAS